MKARKMEVIVVPAMMNMRIGHKESMHTASLVDPCEVAA